ncbi:trichohyalin-like [Forsythia ovata]|uniref:Trichohyalin-like n=1 Tax=Forsythia ovata TaxID=205694 RepID=A0ABD1QES7_9LAMI
MKLILLTSQAVSIANAAKIGGIEQQELDWDSYDKIKREIALKQLQQAAEQAKAKEMARVRAERAEKAETALSYAITLSGCKEFGCLTTTLSLERASEQGA